MCERDVWPPSCRHHCTKLLEECLNRAGYFQSDKTQGYWKHETRPISFSLIVDDYRVKYVGDDNAKHLTKMLKEHYEVTEDWQGKKYSGSTMDWDYHQRQVHLSMSGYCKEALIRFNHKLRRLMDQPHKHVPPRYGAKIQYATKEDLTPKVDEKNQVHPAGHGYFPILCTCGGSYNASSLECHSSRPGSTNRTHI